MNWQKAIDQEGGGKKGAAAGGKKGAGKEGSHQQHAPTLRDVGLPTRGPNAEYEVNVSGVGAVGGGQQALARQHTAAKGGDYATEGSHNHAPPAPQAQGGYGKGQWNQQQHQGAWGEQHGSPTESGYASSPAESGWVNGGENGYSDYNAQTQSYGNGDNNNKGAKVGNSYSNQSGYNPPPPPPPPPLPAHRAPNGLPPPPTGHRAPNASVGYERQEPLVSVKAPPPSHANRLNPNAPARSQQQYYNSGYDSSPREYSQQRQLADNGYDSSPPEYSQQRQ